VIKKLQGKTSAKNFIAENVNFPKIREIAYDDAMSGNDFALCERLCL
jgi:hypothetical protein